MDLRSGSTYITDIRTPSTTVDEIRVIQSGVMFLYILFIQYTTSSGAFQLYVVTCSILHLVSKQRLEGSSVYPSPVV